MSDSEDNLLPALIQIFFTMTLGYLAGFCKIIGPREARGIGIFVGKFSLPALLFISLVKLQFADVNWTFVASVLITKASIFLSVFSVKLLTGGKAGTAGMFAIFCTQTNDFGMGLPILTSAFGADHEYVSYLYLVAPISLLILNPIGFVALEISGNKSKSTTLEKIISVFKGILSNPIIIMTILGVAFNFILDKQVPNLLEKFLQALASAFSAAAPFSLGLSMVGKLTSINRNSFTPIFCLIATKSILSPILTRIVVHNLSGVFSSNTTSNIELENFSFLYGSFPSANGVFSYALHYDIVPELIAAAIIIGTVISAPLMYASSRILKITSMERTNYEDDLKSFTQVIDIFSMISIIWVLCLFFIGRRFRKLPDILTIAIFLQTFIACIGNLIWTIAPDHSSASLIHHLHIVLYVNGELSLKITSLALALALLLMAKNEKPLKTYLKCLLMMAGPILSVTIVTPLALLSDGIKQPDAVFQLGSLAAMVGMVFNGTLFLLVSNLLIWIKRVQRKNKQKKREEPNKKQLAEEGFISKLDDDFFQHQMFLVMLLVSLFMCFFVAFWKVSVIGGSESYTGVYKILVFIKHFVNLGIGIFGAFIFSFRDSNLLLDPFKDILQKISKMWIGENNVNQLGHFDIIGDSEFSTNITNSTGSTGNELYP